MCLSSRIVKQEAMQAHRGSPERASIPGRTNGCAEPRPIDILELLSKAKDEFHRVRDGSSLHNQVIAQDSGHTRTRDHSPEKKKKKVFLLLG